METDAAASRTHDPHMAERVVMLANNFSLIFQRVLTESDGPFAQIGGRSAWPWEAGEAVTDLGKIGGLSGGVVEQ